MSSRYHLLNFSKQPGARERRLQRMWNNPLFGAAGEAISQEMVDTARMEDNDELRLFMRRFSDLVQGAANLDSNESSERILELKANLDRSYTECLSMAGDMEKIKLALTRLIDVLMDAIRLGAQGDAQALEELRQEALARETHFRLLEFSLVADLARPDSVIEPDELAPVLLSENPDAVEAALWLFEPEQVRTLHDEAQALLERLSQKGYDLPQAWHNLSLLNYTEN